MQRSTLSPRRIVATLSVIALTAGTVAGCADATGPARKVSPNAIIIIGGHPVVFNAELRGVGNPDIKSLTAVVAHLQLKLDGSEDGGFVIEWKVDWANAEREASILLGGGIYMIQDSEDFPSPLDVPLAYLLPPEDPLGTRAGALAGSVAISEELATRLVEDPDFFTAVFFLEGGGAIAGTLQLGGPDTAPTR